MFGGNQIFYSKPTSLRGNNAKDGRPMVYGTPNDYQKQFLRQIPPRTDNGWDRIKRRQKTKKCMGNARKVRRIRIVEDNKSRRVRSENSNGNLRRLYRKQTRDAKRTLNDVKRTLAA